MFNLDCKFLLKFQSLTLHQINDKCLLVINLKTKTKHADFFPREVEAYAAYYKRYQEQIK